MDFVCKKKTKHHETFEKKVIRSESTTSTSNQSVKTTTTHGFIQSLDPLLLSLAILLKKSFLVSVLKDLGPNFVKMLSPNRTLTCEPL